ncbi:DUF4219 domain-containing protein [Cephalotus follicularis]|uniref:DUF4219 domain-containing protein n=1 Tax=Cephalotus follicularis TaxID=3775 RepID=A0A1Q3AXZ5_CEPFO|nr:DUF4219 domain-containing protein [Cephalotus follicularis]
MNLNIGLEGSSITRPPFFDENNYSFWKTRMTIFLQSLDYQLWHIIVNGPRIPTRTIEGVVSPKPENEYNDNALRMLQLNSKAKHVLFYAVGPNEFNRISSCDSAFYRNNLCYGKTRKIWVPKGTLVTNLQGPKFKWVPKA